MNNIIKKPTPNLTQPAIQTLPRHAPTVKNLIKPKQLVEIPVGPVISQVISTPVIQNNSIEYALPQIPTILQIQPLNVGSTGLAGITGTQILNTIAQTNFNPTTNYFNVDGSTLDNLTVKNLYATNISMTGPTGTFINNNDTILNTLTVTSGDILMDDEIGRHLLQSIGGDLYYDTSLLARSSDIQEISDWSDYPALFDVDMNQKSLYNTKTIVFKGVGGITGATGVTGFTGFTGPSGPTGGILTTNSSNQLTYNGEIIYGGTGGNVANWSFYPCSNTGPSGATGLGGIQMNSLDINNLNRIYFNTAVPALGGASINGLNDIYFSYATALAKLAGITNVNNIAFWNPQYPALPLFYANMYSKVLTYKNVDKTYIATDTSLSVPAIYLNGTAIGPQALAGGKLECLGSNAEFVTVNGTPCPAVWSQFPCSEPSLNMNHKIIVSCNSIDFAYDVNGPFNLLGINAQGQLTTNGQVINAGANVAQWAQYPATQDVSLNNNDITFIQNVVFRNNNNNNTLTTDGNNQLIYNGQVVTTGQGGNVANWAQYNANNDVNIPSDYRLTINANNDLDFYKDTILNTNIYHGVATNLFFSPDFISYPTTFQVGSLTEPAREISLNAGVEGIGINTLESVITIDAGAAVLINAGGAITMETEAEINLTGLLTTFEIADWNVTAGAVTMEVAEFSVVSDANINLTGTDTTFEFGEWNITAGATTIEAGAIVGDVGDVTLTTGSTQFLSEGFAVASPAGAVTINGLTTTVSGGAVTFGAGVVTIASGGLVVGAGGVTVNSGGIAVTAGGIALTGGALTVSGSVANLNGGVSTTDINASGTIRTSALSGPTGSTASLTNIASIAGPTGGAVLSNIASLAGPTGGAVLTNIGSLAGPTGGAVLSNIASINNTGTITTTNASVTNTLTVNKLSGVNQSILPLSDSVMLYNTVTNVLTYAPNMQKIEVNNTTGVQLTETLKGITYILTTTGGTFNFDVSLLSLGDNGLFIYVKNGTTSNITITSSSGSVGGVTTTLYAGSGNNASLCIVNWNGSQLFLY
jgi:hypothetical protein